jgi:DNA repair protein RecO (recombination protein O)
MYYKTPGIVLHSLKYSDTSLVATIYTKSHGRKSFLIQGVYRKQSKYPPTLFQPLTLLDLEISVSPRRELQRLKDAFISQPFHSLLFDHTKAAITLFLSEILYKTIREEEPNPPMFDFLDHSIQLFDVLEHGTSNFHLWFMVHFTKYLGFFPVNNYSLGNCVFDPANGRFYEPALKNPSQTELTTAKLLHELMKITPPDLEKLLLNHTTRNKFVEILIEYYQMHLGGIGQIKSLQVLQGVFGE